MHDVMASGSAPCEQACRAAWQGPKRRRAARAGSDGPEQHVSMRPARAGGAPPPRIPIHAKGFCPACMPTRVTLTSQSRGIERGSLTGRRVGSMAETAGWTLPDKWSEDLVDENGTKLSKRWVGQVCADM